jgi:hypothetical protein
MSRRGLCVLVLLCLAGCRRDDPKDSVARLSLAYAGFKPGCFRVQAHDRERPAMTTRGEVLPPSTAREGSLEVAVQRQAGWSRKVTLTAEALERDCSGPVVARGTVDVELTRGKVVETALLLEANDLDLDGFVDGSAALPGLDCNDADPNAHPGGTEACDGYDTDCDGARDNGFATQPYYEDADGDGFGDPRAPAPACVQVAGLVIDSTDCDDTRAARHPRPGNVEAACDGLDDDCDGVVDDEYQLNQSCTAAPDCPGVWACAPDQVNRVCSATPPTTWYGDQDGDGKVGTVKAVQCVSPNAAYKATLEDCDDGNPYVKPGGSEICDGRDNDCDGAADPAACINAKWTVRTDPNLDATDLRAGSASGRGELWVAGGAGHIYRSANGPFSTDSACGGTANFTAAWANIDGVYLGDAMGNLAFVNNDNSVCFTGASSSNDIEGLIGFPEGLTDRVYGVGEDGKTFVIENLGVTALPNLPGNVSAELKDVHGVSAATVFSVGSLQVSGNDRPKIYRYTRGTNLWTEETLPAGLPNGQLRGVWQVRSDLAYAVGEPNLALKWNGSTWTRLPEIVGIAGLVFEHVLAFGESEVYTVDSGGRVRRFDGTNWSIAYTASVPLRRLAGTAPDDLWAIGNGVVVRWP